MKRLLSLALSLVMVLGLFAGLAGSASADDEIGQIFGRYLTGDKIDELFSGDAVKTKSNYIGKNNPNYVRYEIYRVDKEKLQALKTDTSIKVQNDFFERLRGQFSDDFNIDGQELLTNLSFDLADDQEYYALKIYGIGDGVMQDFPRIKDNKPYSPPWVSTVPP